MFKNHKLEVKLVKHDAKTNEAPVQEPTPDYVAIAEEAVVRLGKKLLIGAVVMVGTIALAAVLVNATDAILDHTLTTD